VKLTDGKAPYIGVIRPARRNWRLQPARMRQAGRAEPDSDSSSWQRMQRRGGGTWLTRRQRRRSRGDGAGRVRVWRTAENGAHRQFGPGCQSALAHRWQSSAATWTWPGESRSRYRPQRLDEAAAGSLGRRAPGISLDFA